MRTDQQLRDALSSLAERGPAAEEARGRLQLARPTAGPARGRRRVVLVAAGLTLIVASALLVAYLRPRPIPEPADRRVPGHWAMISQVDPPPRWTLDSREVARNVERSTLSDATHKAGCRVEIYGRAVTLPAPVPAGTEPVSVHGGPAQYTTRPGTHATVYWFYSPNAWAVVDCWLRPDGLGAALSPAEIRELIIRLAESVTFDGDVRLLLPIRLQQLPPGYAVESARQDLGHPERWQISLQPNQVGPTTPEIGLHSSDTVGTHPTPTPNIRVGRYPASFYSQVVHGPAPRPGTTRTLPNSVTFLCVPNAPVGFCLSAGDYAGDDRESRREPFLTVATGLTYADSHDIATWFDANDALPS